MRAGTIGHCLHRQDQHRQRWNGENRRPAKILKFGENDSFVYRSMLSVPRYSMGLKLTTRDPENFALLILEVADGTAGSLLAFFEHWLMPVSFHSPCDARY